AGSRGWSLGEGAKSTFRQVIIETAWKSYISSRRPKPRPFLPTIENDGGALAALAGALGAFDVEHVQLAFDVAKDEIGSHSTRRCATRSPRRRGRAPSAGFQGRAPWQSSD